MNFSELVTFARNQSKILSQPVFGLIKDISSTKSPQNFIKKKTLTASVIDKTTVKFSPDSDLTCFYCKRNSHRIENCRYFEKLEYDKVVEFIKRSNLCFGCLKEGHRSRYCSQRLECEKCGRQHPTILHRNYDNKTSNQGAYDPEFRKDSQIVTNCTVNMSELQNVKIKGMLVPLSLCKSN